MRMRSGCERAAPSGRGMALLRAAYLDFPRDRPITRKVRHNPSRVVGGRSHRSRISLGLRQRPS
jgi:hypothetical protein